MGDLGSMVVKFGADTSGLTGGIAEAAQSLGGFGGIAESALGPVGPILAGVASVAVGVGVASVKLASDFQESMDKVQAYAGLSKSATEAMGNSILQMAPALGQSPKALADGLYFVASAGFKGADALNVLKYAGMTAAASNVSATVTASALVAALNGLGLKGSDAGSTMDILNATVSDGVLSWDDYGRVVGKLASSFVGTGESAKQMHTNFVDANAGLDLFTNAGVSARLAATNLSSTINILENKTDSIAAHASKMGISFDESKFKSMDLQQQMEYLGNITDHNSGEMIKLMGGNSGAAKTIDFLDANSKKYAQTIADINSKTKDGATTQAKFNVAQEGFNFQMERAKDAVQAVGIKIGTLLLPVLGDIMNFVTPLIAGFGNLISSSDGLGSAVGGLGTAFAPVGQFFQQLAGMVAHVDFKPLLSTFQQLGGMVLSDIQPAFADLKTLFGTIATSALGFAHVLLTNIGPVFQGLASVVLPFVASLKGPLTEAFSSISQTIGGVFSSHLKTAGSIVQSLSKWFSADLLPVIRQAMPGFQSLAGVLIGTVVPGLVKLWAIGQKVVDEVMPPLVSIFEAAVPVFVKLGGIISSGLAASLKFLMPYILQAASAIGQFAGEIATRVAPILVTFFNNASKGLDTFMAIWKVVWPILAPILMGVWNEIVGVIKIAWALVSGIIKIGLDLLSGNWGQAWTDMKDMFSGIWSGIVQFFQGGVQIVVGIVTGLCSAIVGFFTGLWNDLVGHSIIPDMVNGIITWFGNLVSGAIGWIQNMVTGIKDRITIFTFAVIATVQSWVAQVVGFFGNLGTQAGQKIQDMVSNITGILNNFIGGAASFGQKLIQGIIGGITGMMGKLGSTMHNIVGFIGSFLPHSPAEQGELSHLNEYGPSFVEGFASGIEKSLPRLETALNTLMQPIALTMATQAAPTSYGTGAGNTLAMQRGTQGKSSPPVIENHIHIHIDGQEIGNVITPHVMNEMVYQARSLHSGGRAA